MQNGYVPTNSRSRRDGQFSPASRGIPYVVSDAMMCRLRRNGQLFRRVPMKANGDGSQSTEQVMNQRVEPRPPTTQRCVVCRHRGYRLRLGNDLFQTRRFISLVRHDAIRQLMMDLPALAATQPPNDENTMISVVAGELPPPTANNAKRFSTTRRGNQFCTSNGKRRVSSQPARTLLQ